MLSGKYSVRLLEIIDRLKSLKFVYSEKAPKFCEIFTLPLSYVVPVKSKVNILQNFVAFSEYMNFNLTLQFFQFDKVPIGRNVSEAHLFLPVGSNLQKQSLPVWKRLLSTIFKVQSPKFGKNPCFWSLALLPS